MVDLVPLGMRLTRQRKKLLDILFAPPQPQHFSAEQLYVLCQNQGAPLALGTIYNTLNKLTQKKILKQVVVQAGRTYFDTNPKPHYHIYHERTGHLVDVDQSVFSLQINQENLTDLILKKPYETQIIVRVP